MALSRKSTNTKLTAQTALVVSLPNYNIELPISYVNIFQHFELSLVDSRTNQHQTNL